jgi:putative membrane protein
VGFGSRRAIRFDSVPSRAGRARAHARAALARTGDRFDRVVVDPIRPPPCTRPAAFEKEFERINMRTNRMMLCAVLLGAPMTALAEGPYDTNAPKTSDTNKDTTKDTNKPEATKLSDVDTQAIAHQHAVNQMEIDMGKLAAKNGGAAVKTYAQALVKDHTNADRDITTFAKKNGMTAIPGDTAMTDTDKKDRMETMARLKSMKGADFDREFLNIMVTDHEREVTKVEADIGIVDNKDLAAKLKDIKPVLQKHADDAKALQKKATTSMNP